MGSILHKLNLVCQDTVRWMLFESVITSVGCRSKCGQRIALDIARGLCYLHDKKIVHLDLKSNNILLSRDGTAKIADVGLSKVLTGVWAFLRRRACMCAHAYCILMHLRRLPRFTHCIPNIPFHFSRSRMR